MLFKASAPGSLMLMGEYAVLQNKLALVCAINKRISVSLSPREDDTVTITSALGSYTGKIKKFKIEKPFQFVLTALQKLKLTTGCDIQIHTQFSDKMGFASSAAVTVATLAVLHSWLNISISDLELAQLARKVVREVQGGLGSGADVAACVFGGVIGYRSQPYTIEKLHPGFPITVMYSGSKTATPEAIAHVNAQFAEQPLLYKKICDAIQTCSEQGRYAIQQNNWSELGRLLNIQQGLMDALGVNTPELEKLVTSLRSDPDVLGAKISGSGLGDCVVALGRASEHWDHIPVEIDKRGVVRE